MVWDRGIPKRDCKNAGAKPTLLLIVIQYPVISVTYGFDIMTFVECQSDPAPILNLELELKGMPKNCTRFRDLYCGMVVHFRPAVGPSCFFPFNGRIRIVESSIPVLIRAKLFGPVLHCLSG